MRGLQKSIGLFLFGCLALSAAMAQSPEGRWDITVDMDGKPRPSWLEIMHSGKAGRYTGHFVGEVGSARPISKVEVKDGRIHFSIPPQWDDATDDLVVDGQWTNDDKMSGTMRTPAGKTFSWTAVRAPLLEPKGEPRWDKPIVLFDGKSLTGWHADRATHQWVVENGILRSPKSGANLITDSKFTDFKLSIEFRCPPEGNSGVYLRGRYELQVADSYGKHPEWDQFGAIYGFIKPAIMAAKKAGEWQRYEVTLIGRKVTVVANGQSIITNQEIPGPTGGAIDSNEGEPGPIMLQGDHAPIEYRNIVITPAKG